MDSSSPHLYQTLISATHLYNWGHSPIVHWFIELLFEEPHKTAFKLVGGEIAVLRQGALVLERKRVVEACFQPDIETRLA